MKRSTVEKMMLFAALLLLVSYMLPVSYQPVRLGADGEPAGWLAQVLSAADAPAARTYSHFWQGFPWITTVLFIVPLALVMIRRIRMGEGARKALTILTPVAGLGALALLGGMVDVADFEVWPFATNELAYGAYVALGSLALFCLLAMIPLRNGHRPLAPGPDRRRSPEVAGG